MVDAARSSAGTSSGLAASSHQQVSVFLTLRSPPGAWYYSAVHSGAFSVHDDNSERVTRKLTGGFGGGASQAVVGHAQGL